MGTILKRNAERKIVIDKEQAERDELAEEIECVLNDLGDFRVDVAKHWDIGLQVTIICNTSSRCYMLDGGSLTEANLNDKIEYAAKFIGIIPRYEVE